MKNISLGIIGTTIIGLGLLICFPLHAQEKGGSQKGNTPTNKAENDADRILKFITHSDKFEDAKRKAEAGDQISQAILGMIFEYGSGVERNYQQAVFWYRKAADQGGYVLSIRSWAYVC